MSLADALDRAAEALPELEDVIRPANGDPDRVLAGLDEKQIHSVLVWMLSEVPEDGCELAAEWAEQEAGLAAVGGLREDELTKAGKKALRRVRHRLRSRGVKLEDAPAAPRVATLPEVEEGVEGAFVSPLDPGGSRSVVIVGTNPAGGARIFELVIDDQLGIRRCDVYRATRGKARRFLRDATKEGAGAGVPVSPDQARWLVGHAAKAQPTDRALPRAFGEWRGQITGAPEGTATPGAIAEAELPEPDGEDRSRLLGFIETGRLGPWPPPPERLKPAIDALEEVRESKIVVSGPARQGRFEEILREAAEAAYDEGFSALTAARFAESAYVFWKTGEEEVARACLAGARAFREQEAGSNPVARALLGRLLAPLLQADAETRAAGNEDSETESESLVVKP